MRLLHSGQLPQNAWFRCEYLLLGKLGKPMAPRGAPLQVARMVGAFLLLKN
jgi:hypothetical protein